MLPAGFNGTRAGVRQPWHDIHARVEGPVAMDICLNFMERWVKQVGGPVTCNNVAFETQRAGTAVV